MKSDEKPFRLTSATRHMFDAWYAKAVNDETVWPYMTGDSRTTLEFSGDDDWDRVRYMDPTGSGLLSWSNDRQCPLQTSSVNLWVLDVPRKRIIAGRLAAMIPELVFRYGTGAIDSMCHASNHDSYKILSRRLGEPWGRKPNGAWNGKLGRHEDSLHFRKIL